MCRSNNKGEVDGANVYRDGKKDTSNTKRETGEFLSVEVNKSRSFESLFEEKNLLWFTVGDILTSHHHLPTTHTHMHTRTATYHTTTSSIPTNTHTKNQVYASGDTAHTHTHAHTYAMGGTLRCWGEAGF